MFNKQRFNNGKVTDRNCEPDMEDSRTRVTRYWTFLQSFGQLAAPNPAKSWQAGTVFCGLVVLGT